MQRSYVMAGAVLATALATPVRADVVIGPRVSYYFDNSNTNDVNPDAKQDQDDLIDYPDDPQFRAAFV